MNALDKWLVSKAKDRLARIEARPGTRPDVLRTAQRQLEERQAFLAECHRWKKAQEGK